MSFTVWILETPWGFLDGEAKPFHFSASCAEATLETETFSSYAIVPDRTTVTVDGYKITPDKQSPIFNWQGKPCRRLILPLSSRKKAGNHDQKIHFDCNGLRAALILSTTIQVQHVESLEQAIKMQIERFQCLLDPHSFFEPAIESSYKFGVRHTWYSVSSIWLNNYAGGKEAPSSFITQKAQDKKLADAIQVILKSPSRILQRQRDFIKVAAASELDSACLQWYCKQPGSSPAEKATKNQTILAITRKEAFHTVENRVTRWVIEELLALCQQYLKDYAAYRHTDKYRTVEKFDGMIRNRFTGSPLKEVSPYDHHVSTPNYVLMQHYAYQHIWEVYRQLQKEHKLFEDCWKWQNMLWTETGGQFISSLLIRLCQSKKLREVASSVTYYRHEIICGQWADSSVTPGPFKNDKGRIDHIDSRDGEPAPRLNNWMEVLGCQQMLHQTPRSGPEKMLALWYWSSQNTKEQSLPHFNSCLTALEKSRLSAGKNSVKIGGVILTQASSGRMEFAQIGTSVPLWVIFIPSDYHDSVDKLISQFEQILKFFD